MEQAVNNSTALVIWVDIGDSFLLPLVTLLPPPDNLCTDELALPEFSFPSLLKQALFE